MALSGKKKEESVSMKEYLDASMELEKLRKENGIEVEEKGISKWITRFFNYRENRQKVALNKKKYLLVMLLLGWCGGHRFMAKQYVLGAVYLLLCWTGFSVAMTLIDLLIAIPLEADENGMVLV